VATLIALLPLVRHRVDSSAAEDALHTAKARRAAEIDGLEQSARERYGPAPIDPMAAAHALVRAMPADCAVVDEAITTGVYVRGFHHWTEPGRYFFCEGGGLGWGMPAAARGLARPRRPPAGAVRRGRRVGHVLAQALWTAAHERLPVVFGVFVNREYLILKNYLRGMKGDSVRTDRYVACSSTIPSSTTSTWRRRWVWPAPESTTRQHHGRREGRPRRRPAHVVEIPIASPG
jgi:benzoylformate decarboxylase